MSDIQRKNLFGKLNPLGYNAIESGTVFCKTRGNPYVELIHWIHQILQQPDSDLHRLVRAFQLDAGRLSADLSAALDGLPRGATSITDFSPHIEEAVERGWVYATLLFGQSQVRTAILLVGLLKTPHLRNVLLGMSREWEKVSVERLVAELASLTSGSPEDAQGAADRSVLGGGSTPGEASRAMAPAAMGKAEALAQFSVDLTQRARDGEIDSIVGRDEEIRQIVDILMRRRQNNPILTGEAGVGKTAVVEGFALRIARGDVPPPLKDVRLHALDLGLLQAGASMKGEFENRLKQVIEEVQSSPTPIILFIDEAHTLIGAGGSAGQNDAANLLKPALARGTLRTIAATTWAEYKKYFEKDPALTRRFQVVKVEEPGEKKALRMMRGIASSLESHHRVQVLDEALEAAVGLSHRYIPARQLPDKAVSLLDTACARVAIGQHATPAQVEDAQRRIEALEIESEILARETAVGIEHGNREAEVQQTLAAERARLAELEIGWEKERALVERVLEVRARLREGHGKIEADLGASSPAPSPGAAAPSATASAPTPPASQADGESPAAGTPPGPEERAQLLEELRTLQHDLAELQGESPLILPCVDEQAIASVVADWTGIPVGRMVKNEIQAVLGLADTLERRVIGQRHALEAISMRVQTSRARLDNPTRPVGVFLLAGPSGVGKTETALSLAESLYGGEQNLITINMSEFQEAHTVSTLKGSPPGYVGYGEGGILTEAVRRRPYSVVLLDEIEKAHSDVHEIFFQVFDKGQMEDGEGRRIDFKNTVILLTSNVGSDLIHNLCKDPDLLPDSEGLSKALREPLLRVFPSALLGRLVVVPYYPLSDTMVRAIIELQLGRIVRRLRENHGAELVWDELVLETIAKRCTELESGARMVDAILTHTILPRISREILERLMAGGTIERATIRVEGGDFAYEIN